MRLLDSITSIIIPVCNSEEYLTETLESITKQTHQALEIIAIDDASKDASFLILKKYQKIDKRIKVYKNKKRYGLSTCYNRALKRAKGKYVTFMNPKDVNSLHRIGRQVLFLEKNTKTAGVGTQYTEIDSKGRKFDKSRLPLTHDEIYKSLISNPTLRFETVMLNRFLLPKDSIRFTSDLYPHLFTDLFLNLSQYGKFANIDQNLYFLRKETKYKLKKQKQLDYFMSYIQLWIKSIAVYDYRPSLRSLLTTFSSIKSATVK